MLLTVHTLLSVLFFRYGEHREEVFRPANKDHPHVLSLIADLMDQKGTQLPWKGTQDSFGDGAMQMLICGIKEHGFGIHIFPALKTVSKSANLIIYAIDTVIERWRQRHGYYPTKIYIQIDGGAENANRYYYSTTVILTCCLLPLIFLIIIITVRWLIHHCEHLVQKRICRKLTLTRLPTGHTHEDIDAIFGLIRKYFLQFRTIDTFSQFKDGLERMFKQEKDLRLLEPVIYPLLVCIPDYKEFYRGFMDKAFSTFAKLELTQHVWEFEAVVHSILFPCGSKVMYKAYLNDRVVVFEKKNKDECLSQIGAATGLEPLTLYCPWHPSTYDDPNRPGVEGFYLLKSVPHTDDSTLPPFEFPEFSVQTLRRTQQAVNTFYDPISDKSIRSEWNSWFDRYCPRSDSAADYVTFLKANQIAWHIPLKLFLLDRTVVIESPDWLYRHPLETKPKKPSSFEWPEVLAAAMHSVHTDMNQHPQNVRLYSTSDVQLVADRNLFKETVRGPYYEGILRASAMTNQKLLRILRRKVGYRGEEPCRPGKIAFFYYLYQVTTTAKTNY